MRDSLTAIMLGAALVAAIINLVLAVVHQQPPAPTAPSCVTVQTPHLTIHVEGATKSLGTGPRVKRAP